MAAEEGLAAAQVPKPVAMARASPIDISCLHVAQAAGLRAGQQEHVGLGGTVGGRGHHGRADRRKTGGKAAHPPEREVWAELTPAHRDDVVSVQADEVPHTQVLPFPPQEAVGARAAGVKGGPDHARPWNRQPHVPPSLEEQAGAGAADAPSGPPIGRSLLGSQPTQDVQGVPDPTPSFCFRLCLRPSDLPQDELSAW